MAATIDYPDGTSIEPKDSEQHPKLWAIFSHCFTGSRFTPAAARVCKYLAAQGVACLRFDYPGLGQSDGDFEKTSFSENVADLKAVSDWIAENYHVRPQLLIGHSLGGAAALKAAPTLPGLKAVATIGAPFDPAHAVLHFADKISEVDENGAVTVTLGGRDIVISRHYLEDLAEINPEAYLHKVNVPLMILHSPIDQTVGIDNAQNIFLSTRYPKSLVALDRTDHLCTRTGTAQYAASVIHTWALRYIES